MADGFKYRPKGIDIRIKPAGAKIKPEDQKCEWAGCVEKGPCRAPKSPDQLREYYYFCAAHAREYNKNWNFFSGMTDEDIAEWQVGARHGHRPTWDVRKNTGEAASARKKNKTGAAKNAESYAIFGDGKDDMPVQPRKRMTKMQLKALNDMGLDDTATKKDVRVRYTQLVKQLHPDANGGDRSTEGAFQRVVKAHRILKTTGLA